MPMLPTCEVSAAQGERILAAYGSIENYRNWLKHSVREYVLQYEMDEYRRTHQVDMATQAQQIYDSLTDLDTVAEEPQP